MPETPEQVELGPEVVTVALPRRRRHFGSCVGMSCVSVKSFENRFFSFRAETFLIFGQEAEIDSHVAVEELLLVSDHRRRVQKR